MLAEIMTLLKKDNICLPDYLTDLHLQCGNYANAGRSIMLKGIEGADAISRMLKSLRADRPRSLASRPVKKYVDYLDESVMGSIKSKTDHLSRNLLVYKMEGTQIVIRPSGTEPKLKIYADIEGDKWDSQNNRNAAMKVAKDVASSVYETCLERIQIRLSESAQYLPDYIEIKRKQDFDNAFTEDLTFFAEQVGQNTSLTNHASKRILWLKNRLQEYTSGADPLVAVKKAVSHLSRRLIKETSNQNVVSGLRVLLDDLSD
jgi:hypothetical protein